MHTLVQYIYCIPINTVYVLNGELGGMKIRIVPRKSWTCRLRPDTGSRL